MKLPMAFLLVYTNIVRVLQFCLLLYHLYLMCLSLYPLYALLGFRLAARLFLHAARAPLRLHRVENGTPRYHWRQKWFSDFHRWGNFENRWRKVVAGGTKVIFHRWRSYRWRTPSGRWTFFSCHFGRFWIVQDTTHVPFCTIL